MTKIRYFITGAISAGLLTSPISAAHAQAESQTTQTSPSNIFHADLSHPDLSAAVRAFEQVCMPFVLHETELMQDANMRHRDKILSHDGWAFQSRESETLNVVIEPERSELKPASQAVNAETNTIKSMTGEVILNIVTSANYKALTFHTDIYVNETEPRLTATLNWGLPTKDAPGAACAVTLERPTLDSEAFTQSIIDKDEDWQRWTIFADQSRLHWSQCVKHGADEFIFAAKYHDNGLKLAMRRNDFFNVRVCGK